MTAARADGRPSITVAVCTFNRAAMLPEALATIDAQESRGAFIHDVVVVDDGSTDETAEVVARFRASARVPVRYVAGGGKGVGAARGLAVRTLESDWIAFLDDDERAHPDWLFELLAVAREHDAPVVGGAIELLLGQDELRKLSPACRMMLGEGNPLFETMPLEGRATPGTGNVLIARNVFRIVGGFSAAPTGGEDNELWVRVREHGIAMWHAPRAVVHHCVPAYRLSRSYFRFTARRWGCNAAARNWRYRGAWRAWAICAARIGNAVVRALPLLLWARARRDVRRQLDEQCRFWRAQGYLEQCVYLASPGPLKRRLGRALPDFRSERAAFADVNARPGI